MSDLAVRPAVAADVPAVLDLLRASMGRADDPRFDALFRWKHLDNAFGVSPAWVAVDGSTIVAVRYLMRWEFEQGGRVLHAVRAVDTATRPDHQGRGLFRRLTLDALDHLRDEGVDFVFNTPNDQSRPGYLKMGWNLVGVLPVPARPLGLRGGLAMARARVPAEHFSLDSTASRPAHDVLADDDAVAELMRAHRAAADPARLRTRLDADVLRWRYGGDLVRYRALHDDDGLAIFRLRRRGTATEVVLALVVAPAGVAAGRRLTRRVLQAVRRDGDYVVALGARPLATFVPVPRAGPTLAWRAVCHPGPMPPIDAWGLQLGDIELF